MSGTSSYSQHQSVQNVSVILAPPSPAPPPDDVERTATGIPIRLIWLPYVGLTLLLLAMMCLSFMHYHKKNGHKYRRRREELLKQLGDGAVTVDTPANGGFTISPEEPVNPYHHRPPKLNPHFQPSQASTEPELYTVRSKKDEPSTSLHRQNSSSIFRQISAPQGASANKQPAYSPRGVPLVTPKPQPQSAPPTYPPPQYPPLPVSSSKHGRAADSGSSNPRRHKRPLVFTSNLNGSMVDIRCGVNESHRTFKPKSSRSTSLPTTSIWTLPHLSSRAQQHHHSGYKDTKGYTDCGASGPYPPGGPYGAEGGAYSPDGGGRGAYSPPATALPNIMSDCEDDDVFLLHQTKL